MKVKAGLAVLGPIAFVAVLFGGMALENRVRKTWTVKAQTEEKPASRFIRESIDDLGRTGPFNDHTHVEIVRDTQENKCYGWIFLAADKTSPIGEVACKK